MQGLGKEMDGLATSSTSVDGEKAAVHLLIGLWM